MNRANRPRLSRISGSSYDSRLMSRAGDGSTLTLDFTTGQLDPRLTFSRTSNATFINSGGLVEWAAANMMTRSQSQDNNSYWNAFGTSVTRAANQSDPLGGTGAVKLDYDATSADAVISRSVSVQQGLQYTISVWLRADSGTVNNVRFGRAAAAAGAYFPSLTTTWQRFSLTFTATGGSDGMELRVLNSGTPKTASFHVFGAQLEPGDTMRDYNPALLDVPYHAPRFDHDPTTLAPRGLLIEGAATNLLKYSVAVDQSPWFTAAGVTRTTFTGGTGPDGLNNSGSKLSAVNISSSSSLYYNGVTTVNGTTYTYSVFAKADGANWIWISLHAGGSQHGAFFDLSGNGALGNTTGTVVSGSNTITKYPNGWFKLTVAHTATTTSYFPVLLPCTSNGTGYPSIAGQSPNGVLVYGAQLESGSGASSYIPTVASQVTRNVDYCTMATSSFIPGNPYPNTLFVDCIPATANSGFPNIVRLYDRTAGGTFSYGNEIYYYSAATMNVNRKVTASTNTDRTMQNGLAYNTRHKFATAIDSSSFIGSRDGGTDSGVTTAPAALASVVTHLGVGNSGGSTAINVMNGCIRQIKFWPTALPQATLNALTTL